MYNDTMTNILGYYMHHVDLNEYMYVKPYVSGCPERAEYNYT